MSDTKLDRRSVLKKAAVGGAVAWTAPMIASSTASASSGIATPKCAPFEPRACISFIDGTLPGTEAINCGQFEMMSMAPLARPLIDVCGCTGGPTCPNANGNSPVEGCLGVPAVVTLTNSADFVQRSSTSVSAVGGFVVPNVYPGTWVSNTFRVSTACWSRSCAKVWRWRDFVLVVTISGTPGEACATALSASSQASGVQGTAPCGSFGTVVTTLNTFCATGGVGVV